MFKKLSYFIFISDITSIFSCSVHRERDTLRDRERKREKEICLCKNCLLYYYLAAAVGRGYQFKILQAGRHMHTLCTYLFTQSLSLYPTHTLSHYPTLSLSLSLSLSLYICISHTHVHNPLLHIALTLSHRQNYDLRSLLNIPDVAAASLSLSLSLTHTHTLTYFFCKNHIS